MATILVFPSVLGLRQGITDTVAHLGIAGHDVRVVDVLDGRTFDDYDEAIAHHRSLPDEHRHDLASAAVRELNGPFFTLGFSSGCDLAQWAIAQGGDRARGAVLVGGALPMQFVGAPWPASVPAQTHACADDPFDDGPEIADEFRRDVESVGGAVEVFTYDGTGHLFNDPSLPEEYDPEATRLFHDRLLALVEDSPAGH